MPQFKKYEPGELGKIITLIGVLPTGTGMLKGF